MTGGHLATKAAHHLHDVPQETLGGETGPDFNLMPFWMGLYPLHMVKEQDFLRDVRFRTLWAKVSKVQLEMQCFLSTLFQAFAPEASPLRRFLRHANPLCNQQPFGIHLSYQLKSHSFSNKN